MGMSLAEYEDSVGELNKQYHETAELLVLRKKGVLPLNPDEDERPDTDVDSGSPKGRAERSRTSR